jgi:autophagy-related protein 2
MPWPFYIPEFLKRRACRYLLHHYLGQYLEEKISLDDLTIDLYNGTGSVHNVPLNIESINEVLDEMSAPVHIVSGYIGRITVSIPWSALMKENCIVEVSGLNVTIKPSGYYYGNPSTMTDSLFYNMTTRYY